ncbi:MAG TPA: 4Fe-4S dicluster domain-containing protein [Candidatus Nanoarchaeia archaeon]|nr:4Fe-4S dicluster domain-containing protein [Candidatus Nanoarchaeia archaeon]
MAIEIGKSVSTKETQEYHKQVVIPLMQHRGPICEPLINVDDTVLKGQKIGECNHDFGAKIYSSISGHVIGLEDRAHPSCTTKPSIIIESNGKNETINFVSQQNPSKENIFDTLKDSGIIELNGYPIFNILNTTKTVDTILINLTHSSDVKSNCTPENISKLISGMKLLMKASDAVQGAIIIHKNNNQFASAISSGLNGDNIGIISVKRNYTPLMYNLLAYDVTGMRISNRDTPAEAGVMISSAYATLAVNDAVLEGIPPIEVNVAVSGAIGKPGIQRTEIGTSFKDVIQSSGGYVGEPAKIIMNGLLSGTAQVTDEVPVIQSTSEITVQSNDEVVRNEPGPCIHCARCVDICPVNILPARIASFSDIGRYDECSKLNVYSCVECGLCDYVCPSNIHILQLIRFARTALLKSFTIPEEKESPNLKLGCESCQTPCHMGAISSRGGK